MAVKPVRISNPTEGHLVPLLPGQDFIVLVNDEEPVIEYSDDFFEMFKKETRENSTTLFFRQKHKLAFWTRFSRTYLGEVSILTDSYCGSLCVFLEAENVTKSKFLTIINPNMNYIKTDPQTMLEVVVFDEDVENWDCTIISGENGLRYEQFDYKKIDPYQSSISWNQMSAFCFAIPRARMLYPKPSDSLFEHHYWFKFDRVSIVNIPSMSPGTYKAGKIIFDTDDNVSFKVLNLHVRVKNKHRSEFLEHYHATRHAFTLPQRRRNIPRDSIYRQNIYLKKKLDCDLHSHHVKYI